MPMSTGMMAGIAAVVLLVVIVVVVIASGGGSENDVVEVPSGTPQPSLALKSDVKDLDVSDKPDCSEYKCPDKLEKIKEAKGNNDKECCQKKLCSEGNFTCTSPKVLQDSLRGDTEDECCLLPYCKIELCDVPRQKLKGDSVRGTTKSDCCLNLPTCQNFRCPVGEEKKSNPENIYGNTKQDCCNVKTCSQNGWANKCSVNNSGLTYIESIHGSVQGNTKELCCSKGTCRDNKFTGTDGITKCSDPRFGGTPGFSPLMMETGGINVVGNTKEECCAMQKCFQNGWTTNGETIGSGATPDSNKKCSSKGKKIKNGGQDYGDDETKCCEDLKCSDWTGSCPPGTSKKTGDTSGSDANTCCVGEKCEKTYSDDKNCSDGKKFVGSALSGTPPNKNNCCIDKKCNDSESGLTTNEKCNSSEGAPIKNSPSPGFYIVKPGSSNKELSFDNCCETRKCKDVYTDDSKCGSNKKVKQSNKDKLIGKDKTSQTAVTDFCCEPKKCSDVVKSDSDCGDNSYKKSTSKANNPATTNLKSSCCELKTCVENGWTNDKCRDSNYTRPIYRGKLKSGNPKGLAPYSGDNASLASDAQCCQQDTKNNFARVCVHNEVDQNNNVMRKSIGASSIWGGVSGQTLFTKENTTATQCRELCRNNSSCNSFFIENTKRCRGLTGHADSNANIILPGKTRASSGKHTSIAGGKKLPWKWITPVEGGKDSWTQYHNAESFPVDMRYGGFRGSIERKGGKGGDGGDKTNVQDSYDSRDDWAMRKEIKLAGVDEEFCPYHFVQGYWHVDSRYPSDFGSSAPPKPTSSEFLGNSINKFKWWDACLDGAYGIHNKHGHDLSQGNLRSSCWADRNCRSMFEHVTGNLPDGTTMHRFVKDTNLQNFYMSRKEGRRTCFQWHVGDDAAKINHNPKPGAFQIKSKWIDHKASNAKKRVHGELPPKRGIWNTNLPSHMTLPEGN